MGSKLPLHGSAVLVLMIVLAVCARAGEPTAAPVITSPSTATAAVGSAFTYTITATNTPTQFGAANLPDGISIAGNKLVGAPKTGGQFGTLLGAANKIGTGTLILSTTITGGAGAPVFVVASNSTAQVGKSFNNTFSTSGSVPITYAISGIPGGITSNGNGMTGTPTVSGQFNVTITASNSEGSASTTIIYLIAPENGAPLLQNPMTVTAQAGVPLNFEMFVAGTNTASDRIVFTSSPALPAGLYFESYPGLGAFIQGVPQVAGTFSVQVTGTNKEGSSTATVNFTIAPATAANSTGTAKLTDAFFSELKDFNIVTGHSEMKIIGTMSLASAGAFTEDTKFKIIAGDFFFENTLGFIAKVGKLDLAGGKASFAIPGAAINSSCQMQFSGGTLSLKLRRRNKAFAGLGYNMAELTNIVARRFVGTNGAVNVAVPVIFEFGAARAVLSVPMAGDAVSKTKTGAESLGVRPQLTISRVKAKGSGQ